MYLCSTQPKWNTFRLLSGVLLRYHLQEIMPTAAVIGALGAPMGICPARVKKLQISTNICGKKLAGCVYNFKWSFEDALEDWFNDNGRKYLK